MAGIYRACGRDNPNLYRLMYDRDLQRPLLLAGSEERAVIPAVRAAGGDRDLARAAWAFAHGMTILELSNRFPADADLDAAWRRGMGPLDPSGGPRPRTFGPWPGPTGGCHLAGPAADAGMLMIIRLAAVHLRIVYGEGKIFIYY
jgi:hypothetical protein